MAAATTSVSGYLTSTDWTTFNNKGTFTLPALTSGSVLFSNGSTIAQDNADFFWDATNNRLGIGNASPSYPLDVTGNARFTTNVYSAGLGIGTTTLTSGWQSDTRGNVLISGSDSVSGRLNVYYGALGSSASQRLDVGGSTGSTVDIYNLYVKTLSGGAFTSTVTAYITNAGAASFNSTLNVGTTAFVNTDIFIGDTTSGDGRLFITSPSNQGITLRRAGASDRFKMFVGNGTTYTQDNAIILGANTDIDFYTGATPVKRLTIANGGESTFSGGVTSASFFNVLKNGSDSGFSGPYIAVSNAANNVTWGWQLGASNQLALFSYASSTIKNPLNMD
jgi:hypothetical protein